MINDLDYISWWDSLEDIWKEVLKSEIERNTILNRMKSTLKKSLTEEELLLLKFKSDFDRNNDAMKYAAIKYTTKNKKILIGRTYSFELMNLIPLTKFSELQELEFINATIKNIDALQLLHHLRLLNITRATVDKNQIESFKQINPRCDIMVQIK